MFLDFPFRSSEFYIIGTEMLWLDLFFSLFSGPLRSGAGLVYEGEEPESIQEYIGSFSTGLYVCLF